MIKYHGDTPYLLITVNSHSHVERINQYFQWGIPLDTSRLFSHYADEYGEFGILAFSRDHILRVHVGDDSWLLATVDGESEMASGGRSRKPLELLENILLDKPWELCGLLGADYSMAADLADLESGN